LFFRTVKLSFFDKILKLKTKNTIQKIKFKSKNYNSFCKLKNIFNNLKFFKNNIIVFTFVNLNIYLKKQKKKFIYYLNL